MKLTTKRDRRYFWRELFSYMIPMILIVGTIDVFIGFMRCPLHPEWSAPCSVNWILAAIYGVFLIITIFLAIVTAKMLRKVKKQIENEFLETINHKSDKIEKKSEKNEKVKVMRAKKTTVDSGKKEPVKKAKKTQKNS